MTRQRGGLHRPELARRARLAARVTVVLACVAGLEAIAAARPGGGESFSGGGGHSQGGGGGGGGAGLIFELVFWMFRLVFLYPAIGLPIVAVVVGYVIYSAHRQRQNQDWDSGPPAVLHDAVERSEMGGWDPDGSAGGAGGKAPRGIVHPKFPHLRVSAVVMTLDAAVDRAALFAHLLELNARLCGVAFATDGDHVLLVSERSTLDLDDSEVRDAIERVTTYADEHDDALVARFGGRIGA